MLFLLNLVLAILDIVTFEKLGFLDRLIKVVKRKRIEILQSHADIYDLVSIDEFEGSRDKYWRTIGVHKLAMHLYLIGVLVFVYIGLYIWEHYI